LSEEQKWQESQQSSVNFDNAGGDTQQRSATADLRQDPAVQPDPAEPPEPGDLAQDDPGSGAQADSGQTSEVLRLREQIADLESRLLRTYADFDNLRRRARQEKEELVAIANGRLIEKLLPVLDHFEMAQQAAAQSEDEGLRSGINMVHKQLLGVLRESGLETIDPMGEPFDATVHEAVATETAAGVEAGTVIATLRLGYSLSGKVIRPPMVRVAQ
jgi:molecular chaperone GrpE